MWFSMLYSGEQILSFKSCLVFYAGDYAVSPRMDRYSDLYLTESQIHADTKDSDQTARIL